MLFVRSDFVGAPSSIPLSRTASFAPAAGQNFAETTAKTRSATRVSSPGVSPSMSLGHNPGCFAEQTEVASPGAPMLTSPCRYVIGLGANLGEREATLRSAVAELERVGRVLAASSVYETAAVGPPQPDYLNAAILLESMLDPAGLLGELLAVERRHGRVRLEKWGARTLDLDLLWADGLTLDQPDLTVPHPELVRRPFALCPLLDVVPDARDPRTGVAYVDYLRALDTGGVRVVEGSGGTLQPERNTGRV